MKELRTPPSPQPTPATGEGVTQRCPYATMTGQEEWERRAGLVEAIY